jgi:hypothetical protein
LSKLVATECVPWACFEREVTLFGEARAPFHQRGRDEIFQPIRDYPAMTVREMAAVGGDVA